MENQIKNKIDKLFKVNSRVTIQPYYTSEDYFTTNNNIFNSSECWFEDIEFPQEALDAEFEESDELDNLRVEYKDELDKRFKEAIIEYKDKVHNWDEDVDEITATVEAELQGAIGRLKEDTCSDEKLLEGLAYWTVYFHPRIEDIDVALRCGLVPFYFQEEFYLALGGCGMDLSPKMDAYQAIVSGTIPESSMFFRDIDYFTHVVGKDITAKVTSKAKRPKPQVIVTFDKEENEI